MKNPCTYKAQGLTCRGAERLYGKVKTTPLIKTSIAQMNKKRKFNRGQNKRT